MKRQRRNSRKEKDAFIKFLQVKLSDFGYECNVLRTKIIKSVHLETVVEKAPKVILMAHYDTSTVLPFWYEWIIKITGHTRNILTLVIIYVVFYLVYYTQNEVLIYAFTLTVALSLFIPMIFIPNKYSMNDNTSGVMALLLLAEKLSNNEAIKNKVKIVFTDNEEKMLIGSFQLRRIWNKSNLNYKSSKVISIDSVGRGNHAIISYNIIKTTAREISSLFEKNQIKSKKINMWIMPFSDAYNFWHLGGVNINMMHKTLIPGGYYIKNIHTFRDKEISKDNIRIVVDSLEEYIKTCSNIVYK